jgi:hypothetical protein
LEAGRHADDTNYKPSKISKKNENTESGLPGGIIQK